MKKASWSRREIANFIRQYLSSVILSTLAKNESHSDDTEFENFIRIHGKKYHVPSSKVNVPEFYTESMNKVEKHGGPTHFTDDHFHLENH